MKFRIYKYPSGAEGSRCLVAEGEWKMGELEFKTDDKELEGKLVEVRDVKTKVFRFVAPKIEVEGTRVDPVEYVTLDHPDFLAALNWWLHRWSYGMEWGL